MPGKRDRGQNTSALNRSRLASSSMQDVAAAIFGDVTTSSLQPVDISSHDDGSVTIGGLRLTSTGIVFESDISEDQWLSLLYGIEKIKRAYVWILADWLRYGIERRYGETAQRIQEIAEITGYSTDALNDLAWIAGAIEISSRKENLSIKHHKLVAKFDVSQQMYWLDYAEQNKLSASDLDAAIKGIEVVAPAPIDTFLKRWGSFSKAQIKLAKRAAPHERKEIARQLRELAKEIEKLDE